MPGIPAPLIKVYSPYSQGTDTNLLVVGGVPNYQAVDEYPTPNDSDYVYTQNGTEDDTYGLLDMGSFGPISKIVLYARLKYTSDGSARMIVRPTDTNYYSDSITMTGSWDDYNFEWSANPDDSEDWEWDDINNMEIGIELTGVGAKGYGTCSQLYMTVIYTSLCSPCIPLDFLWKRNRR